MCIRDRCLGAAGEVGVEDEERQPTEVIAVQMTDHHRVHLAWIEVLGLYGGQAGGATVDERGVALLLEADACLEPTAAAEGIPAADDCDLHVDSLPPMWIGEWDGYGPSPPVYVAAAGDVHDLHRAGVFGDAVDHAVVTSPSRVEANQFGTEGLPTRRGLSARGPKMNSTQAVAIFSGNCCRSRSARAVTRIEYGRRTQATP